MVQAIARGKQTYRYSGNESFTTFSLADMELVKELYNFNRNDQEQRQALVQEHGHLLVLRTYQNHYALLYHMGKFFAEVWYRVDNNEITLVRGFRSLDQLQPYLDLVDLSQILE